MLNIPAGIAITSLLCIISFSEITFCLKMKFRYLNSKGALLIILWILLVRTCDPSVASTLKPQTHVIEGIATLIQFGSYMMLPALTLYADIKFGGIRFTICCSMVSLITTSIYILEGVLQQYLEEYTITNALAYIVGPLYVFAQKSFVVIMLLFGTDQLLDASSQQLSSFIWWYYWSLYIGWAITVVITCSVHSNILLYIACIHFICLIVILISSCILRKWFITERKNKANPLKLICKVLNFARKNKYPLQRSALTYWEHEHPSRLDLGKSKYGGPFQEWEVEDVKTFFRLLPIVFCVALVYIPAQPLGRLEHSYTFSNCLLASTYFINYVIPLVFIPVKQFLFKYIKLPTPTMLQRIEFGILLSLLSKILFASFDFYWTYSNDSNITCILTGNMNLTLNETESHTYLSSNIFFITPEILQGFGSLLILPTSLEFFYAQCPYNMRGLLVGLLFALYTIFEGLGWKLTKIFTSFPTLVPSCEFYIFLMNMSVMCICFLLFMCMGRWYKLRHWNHVFSPYTAAADYYEHLIANRYNDHSYGTT